MIWNALLLFCLGLLLGALINVLADDLPRRRWPRLPHYPNDVPRPWWAWSGLSAFLLGARTGPSVRLEAEAERALSLEEITRLELDTRLSWRHPLTELLLALVLAFIPLYLPDHPRTGVWVVFISILALITVIDLEHRLILFVVILPAFPVVLGLNALVPAENLADSTLPYTDYLIGAALGGGVFFLMYLGGGLFVDVVSALRRRRLSEVAFGFGDVMLAALCGLMIGWRAMIFAMFITVFAGAAGASLYLISRLVGGRRYTFYTALPYGPYIVFGTVVMMLFVAEIRDFLLQTV